MKYFDGHRCRYIFGHVSTASTEVVSNKTGPFPVDQLHPHLSETVKIK